MSVLSTAPRDAVARRPDDLLIDGEWYVGDIATVEDCDIAHSTLTAAIVSIENQIDEAKVNAQTGGEYSDPQWFRSAKGALRYKKAALQAVATIRGRLSRTVKHAAQLQRDRTLLDIVKETEPDAFARALEVARLRFPSVYS